MWSFRDWLFQIDRRRQERRRQAYVPVTFNHRDTGAVVPNALVNAMAEQLARTYQPRPDPFAEYEELRKKALRKSRKLLESYLTAEELEEFKTKRYITVRGKKLVYKIDEMGYVSVPDLRGWFCVYVRQGVPIYDKILAYKLYIECNEEAFLREANFTSESLGVHLQKIGINGEVYQRRTPLGHLYDDPAYGPATAARLRDLYQTQADLQVAANETINELRARMANANPPPRGRLVADPIDVTAFGDTQRTTVATYRWEYDET